MSTTPTSPRIWVRTNNGVAPYTWYAITPAANGDQTAINLSWLIETLLLNKGESPTSSSWGIAGIQDVMTQTQPDNDVAAVQAQFAQYFASLQISKVSANPPTYNISVVTLSGAVYNQQVGR